VSSFPYQSAETELIRCNQCGGSETEVVYDRDRNGLSVRTCICKVCGLIYLNPRMTPEWYGKYYQTEYRAQMARFKGKRLEKEDPGKMFEKATRHGIATARQFPTAWREGLTLEVGSSVGGVLNGLQQVLGCEVFGIEPSPDEAEEANRRGIRTLNKSIEAVEGGVPMAANILCSQSLNHLLDPRFFLAWAHRQLIPEGRLVLEVMNFRQIYRDFGWIGRAIQIDHTYMFVPEVLQSFVEFAGFEVLSLQTDESKSPDELKEKKKQGLPIFHIGLVAQRTETAPFSDRRRMKELYRQVCESLSRIPNSHTKYVWRFRIQPKLRKLGLLPRQRI
jgi:SAM-dependent methyltransferase